ncbi:MAG: MFS transporter [Polyangiaceae bacterium]|nr:MFS transporter [Polyangiaceae bacterium]
MSGSKKNVGPLPRAVIVLGWVSFFTDASADMIYPLVPAFLVSLGGGATALGWLEGVAEAVSAGIKLWAGRAIDKAQHPKRFVVLGYGISALSRPLYALASAPVHAVIVRVADRVGKGLRGPPRDALLAAAVSPEQRGHAFGYHRMMDNFGGVAGPILAFLALKIAELPLRQVFLWSVVPGLVSVLIAQVFLKGGAIEERVNETAPGKGELGKDGKVEGKVDGKVEGAGEPSQDKKVDESVNGKVSEKGAIQVLPWRFLVVTGVFTLSASGDLFLMRRLTDLGMHVAYVPMAWVSLQLAKGLFNVPGGRASDRYGRRKVLAAAWALYALTYVAFGLVNVWWAAWALLLPYALHYGLAEGGQRALLTDLTPKEVRGRAFGVMLAMEGVLILPANVGFGMITDKIGSKEAFFAAGGFAALAALLLGMLVREKQPAPT